jgi:hypothetical protein
MYMNLHGVQITVHSPSVPVWHLGSMNGGQWLVPGYHQSPPELAPIAERCKSFFSHDWTSSMIRKKQNGQVLGNLSPNESVAAQIA